MMKTAWRWASTALCIFLLTSTAASQEVDIPEVTPDIMEIIRTELTRKSIELADPVAVSQVLRKYRVRNTSELSVHQVQILSKELVVGYLVVGSIDRYLQTETSAEVALSARILSAPSIHIEWSASVALHTDEAFAPLGIGRIPQVERLTHRAVMKLLKDVRLQMSPKRRQVYQIRIRNKSHQETPPCQRLLLLPFGNETPTRFAGRIVTQQMLSALHRAGFEIIEPGRVREEMLSKHDYMRGETSVELRSGFLEDLGADFILTGTVSRFVTVRTPQMLDEPSAAFEVRLVDVRKGEIVWAEILECEGEKSPWPFKLGYIHGLGTLSNRMVKKIVRKLPAVRSRRNKLSVKS